MLRELLSSCQDENDQFRKKLDSLTQQNSVLMQDLSLQRADKSKELSEIRADLKLKAFELASLGAKYEVSQSYWLLL
jgi:hypothetical protein